MYGVKYTQRRWNKLTYTIYADVLFVINFSADFIGLCLTLYLCKLKRRLLPMIISAVVGGIYSVLSLYLRESHFLTQIFIHILVLILLCIISVPATDSKTVLKASAVFFIINATSGGIITSIFSWRGKYIFSGGVIYADANAAELIILIIAFAILSAPFFTKTKNLISSKTVTVSISHRGKTTVFDALIDSGNLLSDPISSDGIILIKHTKLSNIYSEDQLNAIKSLDVLSEKFPTGIRLISSENGLIPIFRPKNATIKQSGKNSKRDISALIGIDFSKGSFGGADGLIPAQYIE